MRGEESELAPVSYPQLRAAVEARAVLEVGATWLRLSRGPISAFDRRKRSTSVCAQMLAQLGDGNRFVDRDTFLAANEAYHAAVIDLAENEHLSQGFRRLRLRELFTHGAQGHAGHARERRVPPREPDRLDRRQRCRGRGEGDPVVGKSLARQRPSRARPRLQPLAEGRELRPAGIVEDLSLAQAKEQNSREADVDALVMALDARAALEIGITQSLGAALTTEAERDALVARLRAFTPLVRGTGAAHVSRYIRADDAFHRIFFSLLRNPSLFEIYNAMDVPELMRRVLEVAPASIREVFDDHRELTDALRAGNTQRHARGDHRAREPGPGGARGVAGRGARSGLGSTGRGTESAG